MPRINKKTRIKGLPPKIQLQLKDAITGSFPAVARVSSDNRTGMYKTFYDDIKTIVFGSGSQPNYLGTGLPTNSPYFQSTLVDLITDFTSSLSSASGSETVKGIGDNLAHFTNGQPLLPFIDNNNPAVDGKSSNSTFFATGSAEADVGEGFNEPLWSKSKIEIDISADTSTSMSNFSGQTPIPGVTKTMAYYNFTTKRWEPLSGNHGPASKNSTAEPGGNIPNADVMGFTPSFMTWANSTEPASKGVPTTTYGFPYHTKYTASGSQVLHMSGIISSPFVVEKVVLEFSASFQFSFNETFRAGTLFDFDGNPIAYSSSYAVSNFFILNQRNYFLPLTRLYAGARSDAEAYFVTAQIPSSGSTTIRDLVGWGSVASFNNAFGWATSASNDPDGLFGGRWKRDLNIIDSTGTDATSSLWSGRYAMSFSVGTANAFGNVSLTSFSEPIAPTGFVYQIFDNGIFSDGVGHIQKGGNSGLGIIAPSGRTLSNPVTTFQALSTPSIGYGDVTGVTAPYDTYRRINPYILLPTDKITFGWAAPTMDDYAFIGNTSATATLTGSQFTIAAGPAKVILYGSYIGEGKEHNDTLNQLLISNVIHETIG